MPGHEDLPPERLGDFMQTDVGRKVLGEALGNVDILLDAGMKEEQAITIALGSAAVRDDEGKLMRSPSVEGASGVGQRVPVESKKK